MSLATNKRPRRFEEVEGQEHHRRFLGQLVVQGRIGRNLLFYGPPGSGKTTLAEIYASALNCECVDPVTGSPCTQCSSCIAIQQHRSPHYRYIDGGRSTADTDIKEVLREQLDPIDSERVGLKCFVIFIDEVHAVSDLSVASLLVTVESPPNGVVFLFATTELDRVSPALRSRTTRLQIEPLREEQALRYLSNLADSLSLPISPQALRLVYRERGGYPRDLVIALEQIKDLSISRDGQVQPATMDLVRTTFGINYTETMVRYVEALAEGNLARQVEAWSVWNEPAAEKVEKLRLFILYVYYNRVLKVGAVVHPEIAELEREDRDCIAEKFEARARSEGRSADDLWQQMVQFWSVTSGASDDGAVALRLALFQRLVNTSSLASPSAQRDADRTPKTAPDVAAPELLFSLGREPTRIVGPASPPRPSRASDSDPSDTDPMYMDYEDARRIVETGSFLLQEYDRSFTLRLTIYHRRLGCEDDKQSGVLVSEVNRRLKTQLETWMPNELGTFRLTVREHVENAGLCSHTVLWADRNCVVDVEPWARRWLSQWHRKGRIQYSDEAFEFVRLDPLDFRSTATKDRFHKHCIQFLCGALNPCEMDWKTAASPKPAPVRDLMGVKRSQHRVLRPLEGRSFSASALLGEAKMTEMHRNRMAPLSAFADGQWQHLWSGWERDEYRSRQVEHELRRKALAVAGLPYPPNEDRLSDAEKDELVRIRSTWPALPHDRPHSQATWPPRRVKA